MRHLPDTSALVRQRRGELAEWGLTERLLADVYDALAAGNWQRGGGKGPRPNPWPRPDVADKRRIGADPIPIRDFDDWWANGG